ncbi:MAG: hypothetical protein R6U58_05690 [Bacteroidales bacterium]
MEKAKAPRLAYILIFMTLISGSCAPAYVPNVINTPLLSNKGEIQASLHGGISGVDPQLSYAVTDNVGLILNGSFADNTSDSSNNFHKHNFIEIGTGYYTKIGNKGRFETFGGFGSGKLQAEYENDLWTSRADVISSRFFLQPAIGITTSILDASFTSRLVLINLSQGTEKSTGVFAEPALTGKLGFRYVKAVIQLGLSIPLQENIDFNYQPFMFSVGLQANFNKIFD